MDQFKADFIDGLIAGSVHLALMAAPFMVTLLIPYFQHSLYLIGLGGF